MAVNFVMPFRPAFDSNAIPVAGARAYFYLTGTSVPTPVYADADLTTEHPNPLRSNGSGRFPQTFLDPEVTYRVRISDEGGATLEEYDPYDPAEQGTKGDPGGNALAVGLFGSIADLNIPVGTDLIQTSGHSWKGLGAARYTLGASSDPAAPETRYSTNTANGRPVYLAEPFPTVDMFGARPNWNPGSSTGEDSYPAFQAGLDYVGALGGAALRAPASGAYMISQPLVLNNRTTLLGDAANIQGGPGTIYVTGSAFLATPSAGFYTFSLRGLSVWAGDRQVTDFIAREAGAWAYGNCCDNYFVNFRDFDQVVLGVHFINNNFQNFGRFRIGGADMTWAFNYANLDEENTTTTDVWFKFEAVTATDFSHNYITSHLRALNDPIPLEINICDTMRVTCNQIDGGTLGNVLVSGQTKTLELSDNRLAAVSNYTTNGRIPIRLTQDILSSNVVSNTCSDLEPGAPFILFDGLMKFITVRDNKTNEELSDNSVHDFDMTNLPSFGSLVEMSGSSLPKTASLVDGGTFVSPLFGRLWTNDAGVSTANPRINYPDLTAVKKGDVIRCFRSDTTRRWVIYDQVTGPTTIYDSDTTTARYFTLVAPADGQLVVGG